MMNKVVYYFATMYTGDLCFSNFFMQSNHHCHHQTRLFIVKWDLSLSSWSDNRAL